MPSGVKPFVPDVPWLPRHENFKHYFTPGRSWTVNHAGVGGLSDSALYKRATQNLQWLIGDAIDNNYTLRAVGANWSLSPVAMCSGGMLQTKELDLIFDIKASHITPEYTARGRTHADLKFIECGTQIARINKALEIDSYPARSIIASGGSNGQSIAGATATGTHGAALYTGAVHDAIAGIHLVTGRDRHVWIERASAPVASDAFISWLGAVPIRNDDLFNAAVVSFGSFGFIHGIMLETSPLFLLKEYRIATLHSDELMFAFANLDMPLLKLLLPEMPESTAGHELYHMEINMNPYTAKTSKKGMYVFLFYKVPVPPGHVVNHGGDHPAGPGPEFIGMMKGLLAALGGNLSYNHVKRQTTKEFEQNVRQPTPEPKSIGAIFRDTRFTGNIASFAFAIDTATLPQTIDEILAVIAQDAFAGAVAVRFVKGTEATLGFTRFAHSCVVEMDGLDSDANHDVFAKVIHRLEYRQIPYTLHWGKLNNPINADRVVKMYGADKVKQWKISRETLLTPETRAVFTNRFMIHCGLDTPVDTVA